MKAVHSFIALFLPSLTSRSLLICVSTALLGLAGCSSMDSHDTKVSVTPAGSATNDAARPTMIYVSDFYIDPAQIKSQTLLSQQRLPGRVLEAFRGGDPAAKAQDLMDTLSQSIVDGLKEGGLPAKRLRNRNGPRTDFIPANAQLPASGWLVGGWFAKVDEGNPAERAAVGFGAGAEQVDLEVVVSNLAHDPNQPFLYLGTENDPRHMPGGLVMRNPYAMAAKFVLSRGATKRDVENAGQAIAQKLIAYVQQGAPK